MGEHSQTQICLAVLPYETCYVLAGHSHITLAYMTSGPKRASFGFFGMLREEPWAGCTCSCGRGATGANTSSLVEKSVE